MVKHNADAPATETAPPVRPHYARRQAWARQQLDVLETDSPEFVQARFLARLEEEAFVPNEGLPDAYRALANAHPAGDNAAATPAYRRHAVDWLAQEIERFAAVMMTLPAGERVKRWNELRRDEACDARNGSRLDSLRAGLSVEPPSRESTPDAPLNLETRLAHDAAELFPLRSVRRAARRRELLARYEDNWNSYRAAAQRLRVNSPDTVQLAPDLFSELATTDPPSKATPAGRIRTDYRAVNRAAPTVSPSREKRNEGGPIVLTVLSASAVLGVLLHLVGDNRDSSRRMNRGISPSYQNRSVNEFRSSHSPIDLKTIERLLSPETYSDPGRNPKSDEAPYGFPPGSHVAPPGEPTTVDESHAPPSAADAMELFPNVQLDVEPRPAPDRESNPQGESPSEDLDASPPLAVDTDDGRTK